MANRAQTSARPRFPVLAAGALLVLVLAVIAVVATAGGDGGDDGGGTGNETSHETAAVDVTGDPLADFPGNDAEDPAVGMPAPEVTGSNFAGEPAGAGGAGEAQLILFLAHWCPHCQREVPVIVDWLAEAGMPEGVALRAVSTGVNEAAPNFPPSAWLAEEDWPVATLADDAASSAAEAFGLTAYPFFVAVDAAGNVVARASGELGVDALEALVETARASNVG